MKKQKRPIADDTRFVILNAAKTLFLEKGFDGASMIDIAKKAGVNKTLIFHHYQNKNTLWVKVKENIIENSMVPPHYNTASAQAYFQSVVDYRFELYSRHPELARLVAWQQVSEQYELLMGNNFASPEHWIKDIKIMQKQGKLKKEIEPKLIMLFIIYSSYAPFMQEVVPFNQKRMTQYKNIIVESCIAQFSS